VFAQLRAFASFLRRFGQRLRGVGLARTAASLSFTTLLGLVPLFTVAFTYVARFSLFERWLDALEGFLLKFLLPASGSTVRHYLAEFIAKAGSLKGVSIAFVVLTALLLVAQVEREINAIWGIQEPRALPRRVVIYVFGFTAVPVLIGGAVYFTSWLIDLSLAAVPTASAAFSTLARLIGVIIAALVLMLLYALVPARAVPWRHALIGGVAAAIAFESAKSGFAFYITQVPTYQIVYGPLAVLPLFLIWMYVSWIIVLVGAAFTATLAERSRGTGRPRRRR